MISREEVINLAALARLELPENEIEKMRRDLEAILGYVARLKVETETLSETSPVRTLSDNALRADDSPHPAGAFTKLLLGMSSQTSGGYVAVKPIFSDHAS